ncbi:MAG: PTS sugar transporter subunit IIC [Elusimicrobia bacterium]|nr:PTS sugar transporter subunit IIC [Elusimicrobiota bacterium]
MSALAGSAALALLELDASSIGPFLLSRPFVVGPLFGAACGRPWLGAALGAAVEAVTLRRLPLGGALGISAPVAAGAAAWLACGPAALAPEAAFLAGLGAGWAHGRVEAALRRLGGARVRRARAALAAGGEPGLGAAVLSALALQAAATFVVALAALRLGEPLARLWPLLPSAPREGARLALAVVPWFGAGRLAVSLARRA